MTVTLSNGETITIADGETQGTVDVVVAADEDVYVDADSISASISGATGGNFENLVVDSTPATTQITDTTDDTTVSLSATGSITEAGGTVTYTAELTSAAEGDVTVTLSNGETITIADGETQGTVDVVVAADEDVYGMRTASARALAERQAATSRTWWLIARQQRLKSQIPQTIRRLA
ncbi:hypothetical protein GV055_12405 [Marinomonas mediterranea]|nr:immunoglobulin-like domain-containing protein [Marinomonas mediterranea]WCN09656.1 hypothetical protein GV055_12405 [Marinomonas mediterranea]